ncbi:MAG: hypothetical protein R3F49_07900 [Planctomycetota bacterium]
MACALLLASSVAAQDCADFVDIGSLTVFGSVRDISADGQVIVGAANFWPSPGGWRAFRWTSLSGLTDLGTLPGAVTSAATAVSADGTTVVGVSDDARAFRWTAATGMQDLGSLGATAPWFIASAEAVSPDGSIVVGRSSDGNLIRPFIWTAATGMQPLPLPLPLAGHSGGAVGMSSNSGVVIMNLWSNGGPGGVSVPHALLLHAVTGYTSLGSYNLVGISADGEVIVGTIPNAGGLGSTSHRWTSATGWVPLFGLPLSVGTEATDISADGRVIVGMSQSVIGGPVGGLIVTTAVRWTVEEGLGDLSLATGLDPWAIPRAVSGDGTHVAGEYFIPGPGNIDGFRIRASSVGETYCRPAAANSGACAAVLLVDGDLSAAAGALRLNAELLPLNTTGYFLASLSRGLATAPGGSQGNLCLGGAIGRFVGPGQVQSSGAAGRFSLVVDPASMPTPGGPVAAAAGETWSFQAWYRDANPGPTSNFTDAVSVVLQ